MAIQKLITVEIIVKDYDLPKSTAYRLLTEAKKRLVERGYTFYASPRFAQVPRSIIEEILGVAI